MFCPRNRILERLGRAQHLEEEDEESDHNDRHDQEVNASLHVSISLRCWNLVDVELDGVLARNVLWRPV